MALMMKYMHPTGDWWMQLVHSYSEFLRLIMASELVLYKEILLNAPQSNILGRHTIKTKHLSNVTQSFEGKKKKKKLLYSNFFELH